MYKIDNVDIQVVDNYADTIAAKIKPLIDAYLGGQVLNTDVDGNHIGIMVKKNSLTHTVLTKLSNIENLKAFLKFGVKDMYKWVDLLKRKKYPGGLIFKKLGKGTYNKYYTGKPLMVDHFNEIFYDIFVTNGYDIIVNTTLFIQNTGLIICPYCGNDKVIQSVRTKSEIDHFLPKRKYPFFALSYYNLIPSCHYCNHADHKGQLSPIEEDANNVSILNPYIFKPNIVRFHLDIADTKVYEPENFNVIVGFSDKKYLDGYNRFFDISDRYASNNHEAAADYVRFMDYKVDHFYNEINVDMTWINKAHRALFGYTPNSDSLYVKERHRMRKDFFDQLTKLRKASPYYTKGSGNSTMMLD